MPSPIDRRKIPGHTAMAGGPWMVGLILMIGLLPVGPGASAQPGNTGAVKETAALPEGIAGVRVREVIDLVNAGDPAKARAFAEEHFVGYAAKTPPEEAAQEFVNIRGRTGGIDFRCDREFEHEGLPDQTLTIVRARSTGVYWHIDIGVKPDGKISHLFFGPTRTPAAEVVPPPSEEGLAGALGEFVDRLGAAGAFSGTVLVARDGKVLFEAAYGLANRDHDVRVTMDTRFNLASMNKMFTAVAIAQLVERGTLAWNDPVSKYLGPEWISPGAAEKVRLEHLLTHTAGMGDYLGAPSFQDSARVKFRDLADYRALVKDRVPSFEPGTKWAYSNTGFLLLGAVIEGASGTDYFEHMRRNVFGPAGMNDTDCYELDKPVKNLAIGYSVEYGPPPAAPVYRNNIYRAGMRGSPAGGGYSTVRDLLRFDGALRSGKLVRSETFERLITARADLNEPADYAMGFVVQSGRGGGRVVGHGGGGGDMGINSAFLMFLDSGYTFACLSNTSDGADIVESQVLEWIPGTR